jgi:hypothetical protein
MRRLGALLAFVALLAAAPAYADLPADPPLATSSNVHLLTHIPGNAAGMNFKDHYAFVTGWTGVQVLDIAQPASPQLVAELPLPHFENEDVDLCGNTLIVVNDREAKDLGSILYTDLADCARRSAFGREAAVREQSDPRVRILDQPHVQGSLGL